LDQEASPPKPKKTKHQGGDTKGQPEQKKRKGQQESQKNAAQKSGGKKGQKGGPQKGQRQENNSQNTLKRKAATQLEGPNKKAKVQPEREPQNIPKKPKKPKLKEPQGPVDTTLKVAFAKGKQDLKIRDLQDLVLWIHHVNSNAPAWVTVERQPIQKVVVLLIESLNAIDFNLDNFPAFQEMFPDHPGGIPTRGAGGKHRVYPAFSIFLTRTKPQPKGKAGQSPAKEPEEPLQPDNFLLDSGSLAQLDFPRDGQEKFTNYHKFRPATPETKKMVALDCEMCRAQDGNLQLARISILDSDETVLYDKFIKPILPITDYLTRWSGITEEMLNSEKAIPFDTMMEELSVFLSEDTILVGHSLENDLLAMKLIHTKVLDTSVLYPHQTEGHKNSLKYLAERFLNGLMIQGGEHDSVQDALATLRLAQLFLQKGPALSAHEKPQENIVTALKQNKKESSVFAGTYVSNMVRNSCPGVNSVTFTQDQDIFNKIVETASVKGPTPHFIFAQLQSFTEYWKTKLNEDIFEIGDQEVRQKEIKTLATSWNKGIKSVYESLEPNTLFIVFTGNGNIHKTKSLLQKKTQSGSSWLPQEEKDLQNNIKEARQGFAWVRLKPHPGATTETITKMELDTQEVVIPPVKTEQPDLVTVTAPVPEVVTISPSPVLSQTITELIEITID